MKTGEGHVILFGLFLLLWRINVRSNVHLLDSWRSFLTHPKIMRRCLPRFGRADLGKALVAHHHAQRPVPQFFIDMEELRKRTRQVCARSMNNCLLEFYGSIRSGFVQRSSDIDLALSWQTYDPLLVGHAPFDDMVQRKLTRVAEGAAQEGMEGVRLIDCRYPAVQWVDPALEQLVDVGVGNISAVENSKMLKHICDVHPIIATFVHCIKTWAKAREIIAPDKGTMNSFTITTMGLMVLQELGVLPVFSHCSGPYGELTPLDVERTCKEFKLPAIYASMKETDEDQMAECIHFLLSKFAEYFSLFDWRSGTVSLIMPRRLKPMYTEVASTYVRLQHEARLPKWEEYYKAMKNGKPNPDDLLQAKRREEAQRVIDSVFVVEDLANYDNCGRRVMRTRADAIVKEFVDLKQLLAKPESTIDDLFRISNRWPKIFNDTNSEARVRHFS